MVLQSDSRSGTGIPAEVLFQHRSQVGVSPTRCAHLKVALDGLGGRLSVGRYPSYATQFRSGSSQIRRSGTAVYGLTFDVDFGSIRNSEAGMVMKAYLDSMGSSY